MTSYIWKFLGIYLACLFKFISGPVLGAAAGFSLLEIVFVSVGGMMTTVISLTYVGDWFKSYWNLKISPNKKRFSPRSRKIVRVWRKFGPIGVAVFTPLFLTPIGGTIVMNAFNVDKRKIILYMSISAFFWALVLGGSINWILSIPFFDTLLR
ncbi:hypothetical protein [Cognataquiflexum aquatile]|jgi:hypothetical protein|uniref:hypothetical protein n=1 Tax=Cognataquiflexum aquatile TaxID=2249427 RepID=UPI000DE824C1|nr:hypothetical protein [Cognataquiflexum aquatile]